MAGNKNLDKAAFEAEACNSVQVSKLSSVTSDGYRVRIKPGSAQLFVVA